VAEQVLVIGGSWFLGRWIVEKLLSAGFSVSTLNRGRSRISYSGKVKKFFADRKDPAAFSRALGKLSADYVVDVSAYRPEETEVVVDSLIGKVKRFIHISTGSVYKMPTKSPIPEDAQLCSNPNFSYGYYKAECERVIVKQDVKALPFVILRLPAVYGPLDFICRENHFYQRIREGKPVLLPKGTSSLCQNVYVEDVADQCYQLLTSTQVEGSIYNLGGEPFTLTDYVKLFCKISGRPSRIMLFERAAFRGAGFDLAEIPYWYEFGDLILDNRAAIEQLNWTPTPLLLGLQKTFEWLKGNPELDHRWCPDIHAEKALIQSYEYN